MTAGRGKEWTELRNLQLARYDYQCCICGSSEKLELDHIYPKSLGGQDTVENTRILCKFHNQQKTNKVLENGKSWFNPEWWPKGTTIKSITSSDS